MEIPKYFYFRVREKDKGTSVEVEDASDVDVVEVVRCKDCERFWVESEKYSAYRCLATGFGTEADGFCYMGVRKK